MEKRYILSFSNAPCVRLDPGSGISSVNYLTNCEIEGGKGTAKGLLVSATIGGLTGIAGGKGTSIVIGYIK